LTLNSEEISPLYFVAPDEMVYDYWVDGINALLGKSSLTNTNTHKAFSGV